MKHMSSLIHAVTSYTARHKNTLLLLFVIATGLFLFTPIATNAIFFLLLGPLLIAEVIATIIIEAIFWCIVAFCSGGSADSNNVNVCDVRHNEHWKIVPKIVFDANFTGATPWGNREDRPGPSDRTRLSWNVATATACWITTPDAPTVDTLTSVSSSTTYIPGELTAPDKLINIELRCENAYNEGGVSCTTSTSTKYFLKIPPPNLSDPTAFTVTPKVVRYGGTAQFNWNITAGDATSGGARAPYRLNCEIKGALNVPHTFNTINDPASSLITQALTSTSINTLTCTEPISASSPENFSGTSTSTSNKLEVIPRTYEI